MAGQGSSGGIDGGALRLAAVLALTGVVVSAIAGLLHAEGPNPNDHPDVFATYAASGIWTAAHLGQFVGMALLLAGLVALFFALDTRDDVPRWPTRFGLVSSVVALALYGVLQGVDGVALKQAVDAWAAAPEPEKAGYFAAAEAMRWLEWGVRSYQSFVLGLALIFFGAAVSRTRGLSPSIGYLMVLSGVAYLAQGWIIGSTGFSAANSFPTLVGIGSIVAWSVWLVITAFRTRSAVHRPRGKNRRLSEGM